MYAATHQWTNGRMTTTSSLSFSVKSGLRTTSSGILYDKLVSGHSLVGIVAPPVNDRERSTFE